MKIFIEFILILFTFSVSAQHRAGLIISNPIIIQVSDGSIIRGYDIIIEGNIITGVVKHKKSYTGNMKIIDASGKYLIPGLWDMHIHFGGGDSLVQENKKLITPFYCTWYYSSQGCSCRS